MRVILTNKEAEILSLLCAGGYSNKELGQMLSVAEGTIKRHVFNIMNKTGYSTRCELIANTLNIAINELKEAKGVVVCLKN